VIELLSSGMLSTVQDLGRLGHLRFGVGTSGAMDRLALQAGNLMLGNPATAAGIEVPVLPFQVRFLRDVDFAVTGADAAAKLDGLALAPWWTQRARAGQVLSLGDAGPGFRSGARSYLLLAGGVDVPVVLGSRSTQLRGQFGGHHGRALVKGDVLPGQQALALQGGPQAGFGVIPADLALPQSDFFAEQSQTAVTAMRVVPAAEYDNFDAASLQNFWGADWKISAQSDRYGYRLSGLALALRETMETRSHGIVPGVIQVPHSGQPIIQMRDAQPSGGYPKIGTVIEADLWRLGQARAGSLIRFVPCTYEEAVEALKPIEAYLAKVRQLSALYRQLHD
jgi:biotin-dependent carboxylase-like uncharacterized protein